MGKGYLLFLLRIGCLIHLCTKQIPSSGSRVRSNGFHPPCCDSHNKLASVHARLGYYSATGYCRSAMQLLVQVTCHCITNSSRYITTRPLPADFSSLSSIAGVIPCDCFISFFCALVPHRHHFPLRISVFGLTVFIPLRQ